MKALCIVVLFKLRDVLGIRRPMPSGRKRGVIPGVHTPRIPEAGMPIDPNVV